MTRAPTSPLLSPLSPPYRGEREERASVCKFVHQFVRKFVQINHEELDL